MIDIIELVKSKCSNFLIEPLFLIDVFEYNSQASDTFIYKYGNPYIPDSQPFTVQLNVAEHN